MPSSTPTTSTSSLSSSSSTLSLVPSSDPSASTKINERTPYFEAIHRASRLSRALMGGTRSMRAAGKTYLPKFPDEPDESWEARRDQTFLYNGYRIAHEAMVGKAFAKPIILEPDVPPTFAEWAENIDLAGGHLDVFAQTVFADSLHPGRGYILTEFPSRPEGLRVSEEVEKEYNLRPYFCYISADEDMLGIDYKTVNGLEIVSRIRFLRRVLVRAGEWGQAVEERVHVWELGEDGQVVRKVYRPPLSGKMDDEWDVEPGSVKVVRGANSRPLRRIPLAEFEASDGPFLDDMAYKNLEHWQSSSDQRNVLHVARVISLVMKGVDEKKFKENKAPWGPGAGYFIGENASMEYLTYNGDVTMGERDLNHIEEQLVTLSLEPLLDRPGNPTATAKALDQARANSRLLAAVRRFSDALEMAMEFACVDYGGKETGGSIRMNEDFGISLTMQEELEALLRLRLPNQKGQRAQISHETTIEELKRRSTLSTSVTAQEEVRRLEAESAVLGGVVASTSGVSGDEGDEGDDDSDEGEDEDGMGMEDTDAMNDDMRTGRPTRRSRSRAAGPPKE